MNSDCNDPLVCAFERCHSQCMATRDCEPGQLCVRAGAGGVCQLPDEVACKTQVDCRGALVCTAQGQCLGQCTSNASCLGDQVCADAVCVQAEADASIPDSAGGPPEGDGSVAPSDAIATQDVEGADAGARDVEAVDGPGEAETDGRIVGGSMLLDDFNRADGPLNAQAPLWIEDDHQGLATYGVTGNELSATPKTGAPIFWGSVFGGANATTSVFITVRSLSSDVTDFSLLLAAQNPGFCDFVRVFYEQSSNSIRAVSCQDGDGNAIDYGSPVKIGLLDQKQLRAELEAPSGKLTVYVDKKIIGVWTITNFRYIGAPGRIGLWLHHQGGASIGSDRFDDFGGG